MKLAHIKQAYKKRTFYHIDFWSSASSSHATFCAAWLQQLLVVLYFSFDKMYFLSYEVS